MDPFRDDASRGSSFRGSSTPSNSGAGTGSVADDDEYDFTAFMVADGFRPTDNLSHAYQPQHLPPGQAQTQSQIPPATPQADDGNNNNTPGLLGMRVRPSSVSKPPQLPFDSLSLRGDGSGSSTAAASNGRASRVSSLSSDSPVMRVESPYRGPLGPSHPYQMYPQRTLSVTTTSTAVASSDRTYNGPRGPTHPYALYTQNTTSSGDTSQQPIPLGFNGMGDGYQRQLGPDGEEAGDLIGPLGHMEELPPYTRYPDNAYVPKDPTQTVPGGVPDRPGVPRRPVSQHNEPHSPDRNISGAGGIGIATRNPEFSTDDLGLSRSRPSVRSTRSGLSDHDVNTAAAEMAEKPAQTKWQRRASKRMWGIVPYWAICLLLVGLVIMGVVMGAVIGTLLSRHGGPDPDDDGGRSRKSPWATTTATNVTGGPMTAVPTGLLPLATGVYGLPPLDIAKAPNECVSNPSQSESWSCDMPFPFYKMNIQCNPHGNPLNNYELTLNAVSASDSNFLWGTQPPAFIKPMQLTLVTDGVDPGRGPAWWLKTKYNKTVMVSDNDFKVLENRGFGRPAKSKESYGARPGDKFWICKWPETVVDIYVYPNQDAIDAYAGKSTTTYGSSTATTTTNTYRTGSPTDFSYSYSSTIHSSYTSTLSIEKAAATYVTPFDPLPPYPHVLKMLERRYADSDNQATCHYVQMNKAGDDVIPLMGEDESPIVIILAEDSEPFPEKMSARDLARYAPRWDTGGITPRSVLEMTSCGCLWWAT